MALSVSFLQPVRLMPCNLSVDDAKATIDLSVTSETPVRSNATRLGKQGKTLERPSSVTELQLMSVRRSNRVHCLGVDQE